MAVDIVNETYTNIGGFTLEHLREILVRIKGETTYLANKVLMPYSSLTSVTFIMKDSTFFNSDLSNTLLFGYGMSQMRFLESNRFENIWLIDKLYSMLLVKSSSR